MAEDQADKQEDYEFYVTEGILVRAPISHNVAGVPELLTADGKWMQNPDLDSLHLFSAIDEKHAERLAAGADLRGPREGRVSGLEPLGDTPVGGDEETR